MTSPSALVPPDRIRDLWGHDGPWNDYGRFMRRRHGRRVQKISLNLDTGCPHRDRGTGGGGCAYCRVDSFTPSYCFQGDPLEVQWTRGVEFFARKGDQSQGYLAYIQTYTLTDQGVAGDGPRAQTLSRLLERIRELPGQEGLVLSTRPDAVSPAMVQALSEARDRGLGITVELGVQSFDDTQLAFMNRGHQAAHAHAALDALAVAGLETGIHLILGLPGHHEGILPGLAGTINASPVTFLKVHHLQVLRDTAFARFHEEDPNLFPSWDPSAYARHCASFLEHLRPDLCIQRFANESPPDLVLHPRWGGTKNWAVARMVGEALEGRQSWQGKGLGGPWR